MKTNFWRIIDVSFIKEKKKALKKSIFEKSKMAVGGHIEKKDLGDLGHQLSV